MKYNEMESPETVQGCRGPTGRCPGLMVVSSGAWGLGSLPQPTMGSWKITCLETCFLICKIKGLNVSFLRSLLSTKL